MIIITGYVLVDEADRPAMIEASRDLITRARAADGCLDFAMSPDTVDPRRLNNLEIWRDSDALNAWRKRARRPKTGIKFLETAVKRYDATDGGPLF
jgi:quinol monooxygenase YgiN